MTFTGTVHFRSSRKPGRGPPGESEILALNPDRETRIRKKTGWPRLEPGSLNLTVQPHVVEALEAFVPLVEERAEQVRYPEKYQHIPPRREGYRYYRAVARAGDVEEPVLVRRAVNPVPGRVELFAPVKLTDALSIGEGDAIEVELVASRGG